MLDKFYPTFKRDFIFGTLFSCLELWYSYKYGKTMKVGERDEGTIRKTDGIYHGNG